MQAVYAFQVRCANKPELVDQSLTESVSGFCIYWSAVDASRGQQVNETVSGCYPLVFTTVSLEIKKIN